MREVPIGYLVSVAVLAVCTLLTLTAPRRPRGLAAIAFRVGMVVNELPILALYLLLASTALAIGEGHLGSPGGWPALALAALTALALLVLIRRGMRAAPATERALGAGLGTGWLTDIDADLATRLRRRRPWARILFAPFLFRRRDVERIENLSYGDGGKANLLDLYRPRSRPPGAPTLIHLRGGRFAGGAKDREARALIYRLASQGWVCISANYGLSPAARFPDQLIDVKKAIAWARERGPEYGADPSTVVLAGSSAGAHLAAMASLTPNDARFQPGFEPVDTSVSAAVCLYGYYGPLDTEDGLLKSSPLSHVGPDAPPFFVAHGDRDTVTPVDGARLLAERLRGGSSAVVYAELPGAQHCFDLFHSIRFEAVVDGIEAFAAWVRSAEKHA